VLARDTNTGNTPAVGPAAVAPTQLTCHRIAYVAVTKSAGRPKLDRL